MSSGQHAAVFATRARAYGWQDVVAFAVWAGTWGAMEREVGDGVDALQRCHRRGDAPTGAEVTSAAKEFRYARGLLATEDLESWLQHRSVTLEGWLGWIRRALARQRVGTQDAAGLAPDPPLDDAALQQLTWISAICSGQLETAADDLAARAAAEQALVDHAHADGWPEEPWERLEVALQRFRSEAVTEERLEQAVASRQLDWTSVRFRSVSLGTESAARELVLSAAEAGNDLAAAAHEAGFDPVLRSTRLSDVEAPLRARLLSAAPLELIGPLQVESSWAVAQVTDKSAPSRDDSELRAHASRVVADLAVQHEVDDRITWGEHL